MASELYRLCIIYKYGEFADGTDDPNAKEEQIKNILKRNADFCHHDAEAKRLKTNHVYGDPKTFLSDVLPGNVKNNTNNQPLDLS